jgi:hypothetical protein
MYCYVSPIKSAGLIALAVLMTGVSYFSATHANGLVAWAGCFGVVFFSIAISIIAKQLLVKSPIVAIDAQGITAARIGPHPIAWSNIDSVSIGRVRSTRFLCVWLKDEQSYLSNLSAIRSYFAKGNLALGLSAISISFQGLSPGLDEAYAQVKKHVPERSVA